MKNIVTIVFVGLLVIVFALLLVSFQVRETESVLVTTFGKATRQITEPGLYFKWPPPIERVYKFDSRMKVFEADLGETTTKGAVPIIVKTYVVWRIAEPLKFFNSVVTVKEAENKLRSRLSNTQNEVIGQYTFSEFINSDASKIKFDQIQNQMLANLGQTVMEDYGIEIKALGIKQLKINEDVSKDIFNRMRAERDRKTLTTIAQGEAQAAKIRADADSKKIELLSAAQARAKSIRGQGDAEAAKHYKMFDADPKLAMFLQDVEALKKILQERSTIVISADTEPFKLLREMPKLEPKL